MAIFGPDISSYEAGLDLSKLGDASFVIAKVTEGEYYADADYDSWRRQAAALQLPFCWYHFLVTGENAAGQAAWTAAHVVDASLPGMVDVEQEAASRPTFPDVLAYIDACHALGLRIRFAYIPHWYWQQIGSPDLTPLISRGVGLIASSYPGGAGTAEQLYQAGGGDWSNAWVEYGGVKPDLWQFTNQASGGGQLLDYNAFRGTVAELRALLAGGAPSTTPTPAGGIDMTPEEHNDLANVYGGMFFGGASMGTTPPGAPTNSLVNKLDYLIEQAQKATQAVDVNALAAALGPLLHPSTDVGALAAALVPHLPGTPDPGAFAAALAGHIKVV